MGISQAIIINLCALALFFALIHGASRAFTALYYQFLRIKSIKKSYFLRELTQASYKNMDCQENPNGFYCNDTHPLTPSAREGERVENPIAREGEYMPRLKQNIILYIVLAFAFLALFNVKIVDFSLCVLFYSLFDVPSVLSAIVGLNYLAFIVISLLIPTSQSIESSHAPNTQNSAPHHTTRAPTPAARHILNVLNTLKQRLTPNLFNAKVAFVFAIFGAIFYTDILVYGLFDIYSNDIIIYALFLGILAIVSYLLCVRVGVALLVCMLCYILRLLDDLSIICYCIDPFLWVYCVVIVFVNGLIMFKNTLKKLHTKNAKN